MSNTDVTVTRTLMMSTAAGSGTMRPPKSPDFAAEEAGTRSVPFRPVPFRTVRHLTLFLRASTSSSESNYCRFTTSRARDKSRHDVKSDLPSSKSTAATRSTLLTVQSDRDDVKLLLTHARGVVYVSRNISPRRAGHRRDSREFRRSRRFPARAITRKSGIRGAN